MQNWADKLISARYFLALTTILVTIFMSVGTQFTKMAGTDETLLSEDDPYREEVKLAREDFPPTTGVLIAFESPQGVFNLETLNAIAELNRRYAEVNFAVSISSLINFRMNAVDQETYSRDYLIPPLEGLSKEDLLDITQIALSDEDLTKSILSPSVIKTTKILRKLVSQSPTQYSL